MTINLAPYQAVAAKEKRLTRLVIPFKDQPSEEFFPFVGFYHKKMVDRKGECYPSKKEYFGASDVDEDYPCPFTVGQVIGLRYKSNSKYRFHNSLKEFVYVIEPFQITSITAKTLGQLTQQEAFECGVHPIGECEMKYECLEPFKYAWTHTYRRRPSLAWNENLWCWNLMGEVR